MDAKTLLKIYIMQLILIIVLAIIVFNLLKIRRTLKIEKKLSRYTITDTRIKSVSLGDDIILLCKKLVLHLSNFSKKSAVLSNYSKKYTKYIHNIKKDNNGPYLIVGIKLLCSLVSGIIYSVSSLLVGTFNIAFLFLIMIIGFIIYDLYLSYREKRRNKLIEADLLKAIIIMNNAFKSGYNITQAINYVVKDLTGPISEEFARIGDDLKYGLETKEVFDRFYNRVQIEDAGLITSSLSLLNLTGGNLVGIFTSIEKSFTNKKRLRDELNAMTSSSNLVYRVLIAMPFALVGIILLLNPTYFSPLFTSIIGYLIIGVSIILFISYIVIIKKILKVDV